MTLAYILLVLVGAACAVFALQNMDPVVIRWNVHRTPAL